MCVYVDESWNDIGSLCIECGRTKRNIVGSIGVVNTYDRFDGTTSHNDKSITEDVSLEIACIHSEDSSVVDDEIVSVGDSAFIEGFTKSVGGLGFFLEAGDISWVFDIELLVLEERGGAFEAEVDRVFLNRQSASGNFGYLE